ncbi:hypothetical protein IV454_13035 [Massilia antarctica]|uniref:Uncharacterized protein n=1 Tax=Massilia antarctica TaxID=2765360 RepID=A0AA49AAW2_9BURK|nr:hypothetical protein [Massilia antarctica]QPI52322.1 hypothetical protein IV454_13035 [Massilia antarctica]
MKFGERGGYWVIEWSKAWDPSLTDLLHVAPELVVGKRVAITSCDSGPYVPSEDEVKAGWSRCETAAISREVAKLTELPTPGFDEWYVYDSIPLICPKRNHVNQYGFSVFDEGDATELFWEQIRTAQPLHVLGAGTPNMFFATRNRDSFDQVKSLYEKIG